MKKLLPIIAFLACLAIGAGAGAIAMKPAAKPVTSADSTHAPSGPTPNASNTSTHDPAPIVEPQLPAYDPAVGSDDPHVADPPRGGTKAGGATTSAAATQEPHLTSASTKPATENAPMTIESLVRSQTGATVTIRPDGSIGPDRGTIEAIPDYGRMARLLARMSPRDAARTVEQLTADEAARALAQMNDNQSALVLGQLAPERAASLLQAVLALVPRPAVP